MIESIGILASRNYARMERKAALHQERLEKVNKEAIIILDCIDMYELKDEATIISDGGVIGFIKEKREKVKKYIVFKLIKKSQYYTETFLRKLK